MQKEIDKKANIYITKYGLVPEFKAGVHGGVVVASEIGNLKRAHAYHGDVLNTAARIQAKCNELGYDLLVSKSMFTEISAKLRKAFCRIGALPLRGKQKEVIVYGLNSE
jgi:adenylate cyclase